MPEQEGLHGGANRIVVLGSLNVDLVVHVPRLPRAAETVLGDRLRIFPGGKGANQAVAAARLGSDVCMVGRVGRDSFGDLLLQSLALDGVDTTAVEQDPDEPTGAALILVGEGGQNMIAVAPGANARVDASDVRRAATRLNGPHSLLLLQLEVPLAAVESAVQAAREQGGRVILNAAPATGMLSDALLRRLDLLIMNELEAASLFGRPVHSLEDAIRAGQTALESGVGGAIVTLGAAGAVVVAPSGGTHIAAYPVAAVDTTAAGDAFVGALGVALARGTDLVSAARLGAVAGAAAASRAGAQTSLPRPAELEALLGKQSDLDWVAGILGQRRTS